MPDEIPFDEPQVFTIDHGFGQQVDATVHVRRPNGSVANLHATAMVKPGHAVTPRLHHLDDGTVMLELVDANGTRRTVSSLAPRLPEVDPWPRTQAIPPGVWTKLEDWEGSVLNETDEEGTVTVDAEGELTFSVPMRLRHEPEPNYDSWGEDV